MQAMQPIRIAFFLFAVAILTASSPSRGSAELVINGFNDQDHDRFTNDPGFANDLGFIGSSFSPDAFSGIGIAFTPQFFNPDLPPFLRYGTLVSRNVIVTSSHAPAVGEITFYPSNDPNATPVVRNITSNSIVLDDSDLRASVLDAPVPVGLATYSFANEFFSGPPPQEVPTPDPNDDPNATTFENQIVQGSEVPFIDDTGLGELVLQVGGSPIDRSLSLDDRRIDQAVGQNRVSGYVENTFSNLNDSNNDTLLLVEERPGDDEFVDSESLAQGGDSGAPVFQAVSNDDLVLIGLNSIAGRVTINSGTPDEDERNFSGIAYIGNRATSLNAFISANAIPEPSATTVLLSMFCSHLLIRRRTH